MGMTSTDGNLALVDSFATENAPIVDRLIQSGAIILGNTTLSVREPAYDIAVAAGFAPVATGTETEGSLVSPATRQSLWRIKPTLGSIPNQGIIPVSCDFDIAGPNCKTVQDTAVVLAAPGQRHQPSVRHEGAYIPTLKGLEDWKEIRVGTLDLDTFRYDESFQTLVPEAIDQIKSATLQGYKRIRKLAGAYHPDVTLRPISDFNFAKGNPFVEVMGYPLCSLPLGYIAYNGRPIGLTAIAKSEVTLLTLMSASEAIFSRQSQSAFLEHEDEWDTTYDDGPS
ncbi:Amidase, partial [Metarhizium majus ARSEF 297]